MSAVAPQGVSWVNKTQNKMAAENPRKSTMKTTATDMGNKKRSDQPAIVESMMQESSSLYEATGNHQIMES